MTRHRNPTTPSMPARTAGALAVLAAAAAALTACGPVGVHSYDAFSSAVDKGAGCRDLLDMRKGFHRDADLTRIDADLTRVGCTSAAATRTDR